MMPSKRPAFTGKKGTRVSPPKPFRLKKGNPNPVIWLTIFTVAKVGRSLENVSTPESCQLFSTYFEKASVRLVKLCCATQEYEAVALIAAFEEHARRGAGAFAWKGQMMDMPHLTRARKIVERARHAGVI